MDKPKNDLNGFPKNILNTEPKIHYTDAYLREFQAVHGVDQDLKESPDVQKFFKELRNSYDNILFAVSTYPEKDLNFSLLETQMDYFLETNPNIMKYIKYRTKVVRDIFKKLFTQPILSGLLNKTSELNSDNEKIHKNGLLERSLLNLKNA